MGYGCFLADENESQRKNENCEKRFKFEIHDKNKSKNTCEGGSADESEDTEYDGSSEAEDEFEINKNPMNERRVNANGESLSKQRDKTTDLNFDILIDSKNGNPEMNEKGFEVLSECEYQDNINNVYCESENRDESDIEDYGTNEEFNNGKKEEPLPQKSNYESKETQQTSKNNNDEKSTSDLDEMEDTETMADSDIGKRKCPKQRCEIPNEDANSDVREATSESNKADKDVDDNYAYVDNNEKSIKKFKISFSYKEWKHIRPTKNRPHKLATSWTDAFSDKVNEQILGCFLAFRYHNVNTANTNKRTYFNAQAVCKHPGCGIFKFYRNTVPDKKREAKVEIGVDIIRSVKVHQDGDIYKRLLKDQSEALYRRS